MSQRPTSRNTRTGAKKPVDGKRTSASGQARTGGAGRSSKGPPEAARRRRNSRRGSRRWVLPTLLSLITVLVVVVYCTPLLSVRSVRVSGNATLSEGELLSAAQVREGKPMLRIDTGEIQSRLLEVSRVASAEVSLSWPSSVQVEVTERVPAAFAFTGKEFEILDTEGVRFASRRQPPAELPELKVQARKPGRDDPATRAAVTVLRSLPPEIRGNTVAVTARSPGDIHLVLTGDRRVRWGGIDESARKAAILPALLTRPGSVYDVITPALPTVS